MHVQIQIEKGYVYVSANNNLNIWQLERAIRIMQSARRHLKREAALASKEIQK